MSKFIARCISLSLVLAIFPRLLSAQTTPPSKPIQIKVVVVALFERGEDTGDTPGEYQLWVEREHLDPRQQAASHWRVNEAPAKPGGAVTTSNHRPMGKLDHERRGG